MTGLWRWIFEGVVRRCSREVRVQVVSSLSEGVVNWGGRGVPALWMEAAMWGMRRRVGVVSGEGGVVGGLDRALIRLKAWDSFS